MSPQVPAVITGYFEADKRRDIDAVVALFTADAVVVDEGQTWRGVAAIRGWREGPASLYQYTTEVQAAERTGGGTYRGGGRLAGNFPGGTAGLIWAFTAAGGRVSRL